MGAGALGGMFWGLLFGLLFFIPLLGAAIGAGMGALAGSLGIHTVAEGIENVQQQQAVRELGCAMGQGYLYGRPLPELVGSIDPLVSLVG